MGICRVVVSPSLAACISAPFGPRVWLTHLLLNVHVTQPLKLTAVDAKIGLPVTQGNVPFFALDTLLQFPRFEKVPPEDKEAVRERFFWGLEHEDLGMCTLGAWGIEHTNQPAFLQTEDEVSQHCSLPRGRTGDDGAGGVETDREWCWRGSTSGSQVC